MITGKDLIAIGYPQGKVIGLALEAASHLPHNITDTLPDIYFQQVLDDPYAFLENDKHKYYDVLSPVAQELVKLQEPDNVGYELQETGEIDTWGTDLIDEATKQQMRDAMSLPVSKGGVLMPDAHLGYGLPVGGVLATENTVIPWAVGVDIGCRMKLSVFDMSWIVLGQKRAELRKALEDNTVFGAGKGHKIRNEHPVMDSHLWNTTGFTRSLKDTGYAQLGSSGSGNHFVEWGMFHPKALGMIAESRAGDSVKLAILSHSGSRGVGFKIAQKYSKIAANKHEGKLPKHLINLAWLDLSSEEGMEYWLSMQLAGDFASANHDVIHDRLSKAIAAEPIFVVENHHNFAWKENGQIIHRKGATPAGEGVYGVIPGSMAQPGYVVKGKGNASALNSASHGAGRTMSRSQAKKTLTPLTPREMGIELIGGGVDEHPGAYKDIETVIGYQKDLVDVVGKFTPKIVRMDK